MIIHCAICDAKVPVQFKNSHHERPQAAGGGAEDEVDLCVNCHQNLHRVADLLKANRGSEAQDAAKIAYPQVAVREKLFKFAMLCVEWMRLKEDGKLKLDDEVQINFVVPAEVKVALTQMAADRKMGVSRFCGELVKGAVFQKYPSLRKPPPPRAKKLPRKQVEAAKKRQS